MPSPISKPTGCLATKPTEQSVLFCHEFINLSQLARLTHISVSGLSLVFSGKRQPSVKNARKMAAALETDLGDFLKEL